MLSRGESHGLIMNLPNKLSLIRVIMVPIFVAVIVLPFLPDTWSRILGAAIFILTAFTDFLDGMIARKFNLITDFGKFIDPLADKFMVFGAMLAILYKYEDLRPVFIWAALIVIFRELAITSMRLILSSGAGKVVAAAWLGKVKTVTQIVCIVVILLEPVILPSGGYILSYITIAAMTVMTVWSGIDYMKTYWQFLDPTK